MAERPDLNAIGGKLVDWEKYTMGEYEDWCEDLLTVVRYCRELEAEIAIQKKDSLDLAAIVREQGCKIMDLQEENKRLRADIDWQNRIGDLETAKN